MNLEKRSNLRQLGAAAKTALDVIATILVIVASGAVIVTTLLPRIVTSGTPTDHARPAGQLSVPRIAQSLSGLPTIGGRNAKVAIIEYSDFQCPFCATFANDTFKSLKRDYLDSGRVLLAFRNFPLQSHPTARSAAKNAVCASEQGRFWQMHDLLFERQGEPSGEAGQSLAANLGLDAARFDQCMRTRASAQIDRDVESAAAIGITATPTFVLGVIESADTVKATHVLVGAESAASFGARLDQLLQLPSNAPR
jgi:protein-disulfide isomerase